MIIFINGSFGIGKTTTASLLRTELPASIVFDPEPIGLLLQLLSRVLPLAGGGTDDFQDIRLWRRATILGLRLASWMRPTVIVPMTFSNLEYLKEIRSAVVRPDREVFHVCLTAPLGVVQRRLAERAAADGAEPTAWALRRAAECCTAHESPDFESHVPTASRPPSEIAADIANLLRQAAQASRNVNDRSQM